MPNRAREAGGAVRRWAGAPARFIDGVTKIRDETPSSRNEIRDEIPVERPPEASSRPADTVLHPPDAPENAGPIQVPVPPEMWLEL